MKMIGHFRDWSVGQNGFPVGHVRCPALISTTDAESERKVLKIYPGYEEQTLLVNSKSF